MKMPAALSIVVHIAGGTDWPPILLSGLIGSFIGVLGAAAIAYFALKGQIGADRKKAQDELKVQRDHINHQHRVALTTQALVAVGEMQRIVMSGVEGDHSKIGATRAAAIGQWTITNALVMTAEPSLIAGLEGMFTPVEEFVCEDVEEQVVQELRGVAAKLFGLASALSMKLMGLTGVKHSLSTTPDPVDDPSTDEDLFL